MSDKEILPTEPDDNEDPVFEDPQSTFEVTGEPQRQRTAKGDHSSVKRRPLSLGIGTVAVIVAFAILVTFMATYVLTSYKSVTADKGDAYEGLSEEASEKIRQISQVLGDNYLYEIDGEKLTDTVLKGYMYGLGDPYAEYFTAEEFQAMMSDTNAEMQGIGISVVYNAENVGIQITDVFPESPAMEAGVQPGDLIVYVKVDDEMVSVASLGYTMAVTHLQGEAGTMAEFIVARGENYKETCEFSIERGFVTEYTVRYRVHSLDSTVGVIRITSFDKKTPDQFREAYDDLTKQGCTRLVIDVRNNPGGELISVCTTLDMLVPEGPVIRTVDREGNEKVEYKSDKEETSLPIAVLTNGNTASAGELFAATLRDYEKAVLVGEKTFGKGSMQTTMSFSDGTAFKFTYRYYCPPYSDNYDGVGIIPDKEVVLPEDVAARFYTMTDAEDTQLSAAVDELNK